MLNARDRNEQYKRELEIEQQTEVEPKKRLPRRAFLSIAKTLGLIKRTTKKNVDAVIEVDKPEIQDMSINPPVQE